MGPFRGANTPARRQRQPRPQRSVRGTHDLSHIFCQRWLFQLPFISFGPDLNVNALNSEFIFLSLIVTEVGELKWNVEGV